MISVVIPAYNEEEGIAATLEILGAMAINRQWEVIVVNDGSSDKTASIVKKFTWVNLISHRKNLGYGASLKTGIKNAKNELIAFYDADGQHIPEDLLKLYENLEEYDMIVGARGSDSHADWTRKPGKWILSKVANYLTNTKIPDLNSGLRIVRKNIISKYLHLFPNGFSFSTTSTIAMMNLGYDVKYIPIKVKKRVGKSTVKQLKHGSNVLLLILRLIVLFNPLKIFITTSKILFFLGVVYEIIWGIIIFPNGVRLIPGALFILLTSIIIFFFGLVVDQISELRKHLYD